MAGFQRCKRGCDVFNKTPHTGPVLSSESLKSIDPYFAWRRTPEGEAWVKYNCLYFLVTQ